MIDGVTPQQLAIARAFWLERLGVSIDRRRALASDAVARCAAEQLAGALHGAGVISLVGTTESGVVALLAGERLMHWGAEFTALLGVARGHLDPTIQVDIERIELLGGNVYDPGAPAPRAALWLDGLFGPTPPEAGLNEFERDLVELVNHDSSPTLAIEVPSGLDGGTGKATLPAIRADWTLALDTPLVGLVKPFAKQLVGTLLVADLGLPAQAWRQAGVVAPQPVVFDRSYYEWHSESSQ